MIKPTPNPPEHEDTSPYESFDSKKLHEAADRALDLHLGTDAGTAGAHRVDPVDYLAAQSPGERGK